jgi:hypothetical protein
MSMLIEPLDIETPVAAFNGGLLVNRDMSVIEQRVVPEELVTPVADLIGSFRLDTWVYRGPDWYVPDPQGSHVARESRTVQFEPKVMTSLGGLTSDVAKLVGVSDDLDAVARYLSAKYGIPPQAIATIGRMGGMTARWLLPGEHGGAAGGLGCGEGPAEALVREQVTRGLPGAEQAFGAGPRRWPAVRHQCRPESGLAGPGPRSPGEDQVMDDHVDVDEQVFGWQHGGRPLRTRDFDNHLSSAEAVS